MIPVHVTAAEEMRYHIALIYDMAQKTEIRNQSMQLSNLTL